jgi:putative ABC transport system permease protein
VPNLWAGGLDAPATDRNPAAIYVPLAQAVPVEITIAGRIDRGEPLQLAEAVRAAAFKLDPDVPIYDVRSMPQLVVDNSWFYGFGAGIMIVCAVSALLLAMIGLYGVIAFSVGRRIREFGIRMAVGAVRGDIVRLVLRQGAPHILVGVALGLALAIVLSGGIVSLLFNVRPTDPVVLSAVAATLVGIALIATLLPAVRAARIDPLTALREE